MNYSNTFEIQILKLLKLKCVHTAEDYSPGRLLSSCFVFANRVANIYQCIISIYEEHIYTYLAIMQRGIVYIYRLIKMAPIETT